MKINTNISSLQAQRNLSMTTKALARALERLSSGSRINHAGDDASGLAIANGLEAQRRGFTQTIRNLNNAQGWLATADGVLETQTELVMRMRELAVQAASGTMSNTERSYLNTELQTLSEEFERIAKKASFNGSNLLDGSFGTKSLQVGNSKGETIEFSIESSLSSDIFTDERGTGTFETREATSVGSNVWDLQTGDFNGDGNRDLVVVNNSGQSLSILLGDGSGGFSTRSTITTGLNFPRYVEVGDLNGDGKDDLVVSNAGNNSLWSALGNGDGTFQSPTTTLVDGSEWGLRLGDYTGDGILDVAIANLNPGNSVTLLQGMGNGSFGNRQTISVGTNPIDLQFADLNSDGLLDLLTTDRDSGVLSVMMNLGNSNFAARATISSVNGPASLSVGDLNGDGKNDLVVSNVYNSQIGIHLGNGDGTFASRTTLLTNSTIRNKLGDVDEDGDLDIVSQGSSNNAVIWLNNGSGTFSISNTISLGTTGAVVELSLDDMNNDGALDLLTLANTDSQINVNLNIVQTYDASNELDISTQSKAQDLLGILDNALENLSSRRSGIGAIVNRLESAENSSSRMLENLSAAHSQIMDVDIAEETAELTRQQILQQASISVLSQANLGLRVALELLKF